MATSFETAVSTLLCEEDESILDDGDSSSVVMDTARFYAPHLHEADATGPPTRSSGFSLPPMDEDSVSLMIEKETLYQPNNDYIKRLRNGDWDLDARREAVISIAKLHSHFGFGPACASLAINYLDRFLSAYVLPKNQAWTTRLLSVAVLSLAAKMEETDVPSCMDLQMDSKYVFEAKTIQRMELLVLNTLRWRMHAITPLSYIDHFLSKLSDDASPSSPLILQSIPIILGIIKGIDFLEFRPSEIAAAVAIAAIGATESVDLHDAVSGLNQQIEKSRVEKCMKLVHDSAFMGTSGSVFSLPQSPIGVLDATFFSYSSDDIAVGSCVNSPQQSTPPAKRRKLCESCEA